MGTKEANNEFDSPGNFYLSYKDGGILHQFLVNVKSITDNGTSSKLYVIPTNKAVYNMTEQCTQSVHKYNWVGLLDVKNIQNSTRTSTTIKEQQHKQLMLIFQVLLLGHQLTEIYVM